MAFRTFTDSLGVEWSAWDVTPRPMDRRIYDRRLLPEPVGSDRRGVQRRQRRSGPAALATLFVQGWLCFEARQERRRLIPIPGDWPACADDRLEAYCQQARPVTRIT